jgi:hypothetical protein
MTKLFSMVHTFRIYRTLSHYAFVIVYIFFLFINYHSHHTCTWHITLSYYKLGNVCVSVCVSVCPAIRFHISQRIFSKFGGNLLRVMTRSVGYIFCVCTQRSRVRVQCACITRVRMLIRVRARVCEHTKDPQRLHGHTICVWMHVLTARTSIYSRICQARDGQWLVYIQCLFRYNFRRIFPSSPAHILKQWSTAITHTLIFI